MNNGRGALSMALFVVAMFAAISAKIAVAQRGNFIASGTLSVDAVDVRAPLVPAAPLKFAVIKPLGAIKNAAQATGAQNPQPQSSAPKPQPLAIMQKIEVREGNIVRRGQILAKLDPATFNDTIKQAEANLSLAKANYDTVSQNISSAFDKQAQLRDKLSQLKQAQDKLAALQSQTASGQKPGSGLPGGTANGQNTMAPAGQPADQKDKLSQANAALNNAVAQIDTAVKKLSQAQIKAQKGVDIAAANLKNAIRIRDQLTIVAPIAGYISQIKARPGELIFANRPLLTISPIAPIKLKIYLPLDQAEWVKKGERAAVTVDAYPNLQFVARVTEVAPDIQFAPSTLSTEETHLSRVKAVTLIVTNRKGILKPGMPADAELR